MNTIKKKCTLTNILFLCFPICIFTYGMYYEFCGAAWTVFLSVILLLYWNKSPSIKFRLTMGTGLYLLLLAGYALTIFYAVDSGMAFLGLGKILWIGPFIILYQQLDKDGRQGLFHFLPWIGVFEAAIGIIGYFILVLKPHLWVNGRLGGTFQYPNTFALFLLVGAVILLHEEKLNWKDMSGFAVLCIGIGFSGSRTVMVMSLISVLILIVLKRHWKLGILAAVLGITGAFYIFAAGDTASLGRILKISLTESTFVGRLLYAWDALALLARRPFGMGYMGYYYSENMIQTGVYTVRYVHNDWLQIGLDTGWIPMAAYLLAVVMCLWSKKLSSCKKWVLVLIFLHGLLDYDLAYTVILCLVAAIMDDVPLQGLWRLSAEDAVMHKKFLISLVTVNILLGTYIIIPSIAEYAGNYPMAVKAYPWHTEANLHLISESDDIDEVEGIADCILKQNDTCALAYYAKAYSAYCRDDYADVIPYQREAIKRDYFNYEEYLNYALMLYDGILYCDNESIRKQCCEELLNIPKMLDAAKDKVSFLGRRIFDQPELEIDAQLQDIIDGAVFYGE